RNQAEVAAAEKTPEEAAHLPHSAQGVDVVELEDLDGSVARLHETRHVESRDRIRPHERGERIRDAVEGGELGYPHDDVLDQVGVDVDGPVPFVVGAVHQATNAPTPSTTIVRTASIARRGQTQRRYVPYGTFAMARPPMTTAEVGMNRFMSPEALWYAVTTRSLGTPTKSASGAMIGIGTGAGPGEDGIRNDSGRNRAYVTMAKRACPMSPRASSAQCSTVSVIWPLFMITVMPRAMPMIRATPRRSRAPATNASVRSVSLRRPTSPMMTENRTKDAVISGNHHHRVGRQMPRSSHGMTPYIITANASPKIASITLCVPVIAATSPCASTRK